MRMMLVSTSVVLTAFGLAVAAEELKSGLPVGAPLPAYTVRDITGPNKGVSLCYRCKYGEQPVVNIFAREMTDEVASLVKQLDKKVGENRDKKMAGFVVLLTDDSDAAESKLKEVATKHKLENIPLTVFEGPAGPESYKIDSKADVTVMLWVDGVVKSNFAFEKGKLKKDGIDKIVKDTAKILE
jgi:hypothetical protein